MNNMDQITKQKLITKDMTIGDILGKHSSEENARELAEIMTLAGLHCVGCGASTFETLEQGALGHGFSEEKLNKLIIDLNAVIDSADVRPGKKSSGQFLTLTDVALKKVDEIMKAENKENYGLRVAVSPNGYELDIQEKPQEGDVVLNQDGLEIFVDKGSTSLLKGVQIDYINELGENGFKFDNPNARAFPRHSGSGCCGG